MEFLSTIDIETLGFVGLTSFGLVALVNYKYKLNPLQNFILSVGIAFVLGFVPVDWGNFFFNKVKEALAVAGVVNGAYQSVSGIAKKVAGH